MAESKSQPSLTGSEALQAVLEVWAVAGRTSQIPVVGSSMQPFLCHGDQLEVIHGHARLKRGDVVVFRQGDMLVAHRLLRVENDGLFLTKGDNARHVDSPVLPRLLLGRVVAARRYGQVMRLDTSLWRFWGWLIAAATLAGMMVYAAGRRMKRLLMGNRTLKGVSLLKRILHKGVQLLLYSIKPFVCRWRAN